MAEFRRVHDNNFPFDQFRAFFGLALGPDLHLLFRVTLVGVDEKHALAFVRRIYR